MYGRDFLEGKSKLSGSKLSDAQGTRTVDNQCKTVLSVGVSEQSFVALLLDEIKFF